MTDSLVTKLNVYKNKYLQSFKLSYVCPVSLISKIWGGEAREEEELVTITLTHTEA